MSVLVLLPLFSGLVAALVINYLADVLPDTFRLSRPVCSNPECRKPFAWIDYLLMRPCRHCSKPRGWRPYLILVLCVMSSVALWFTHPARLGFGLGLLLLTYFYVVALIDLEHHDILSSLSLAGLLLTGLTGILMHGWLATLLGGLAGFAIMALFYLFGKLFTRLRARRLGQPPGEVDEALGSGDVTLATILGLFLGWPLTWYGLLLGTLFAGLLALVIVLFLAFVRRYRQNVFMVFIPFGPAFIISTIILIYLPNWINAVLPG
jgi:leader peptidase (prepilin peptidase) / N-methyltransferase